MSQIGKNNQTKNGKYKKIKTTSKKTVNLPLKQNGLTFFKVRGIKGDKKSKFASPVMTYAANIKLLSADLSGNDLLLKIEVDNTGTSTDMQFVSNLVDLNIEWVLNENEQANEDDESYLEISGFKCTLTDEHGKSVNDIVIGKDSIGYLYAKCSATDNNTQYIKYAYKALENYLCGGTKYSNEYRVDINTFFLVETAGKTYQFYSSIGVVDTTSWGEKNEMIAYISPSYGG